MKLSMKKNIKLQSKKTTKKKEIKIFCVNNSKLKKTSHNNKSYKYSHKLILNFQKIIYNMYYLIFNNKKKMEKKFTLEMNK